MFFVEICILEQIDVFSRYLKFNAKIEIFFIYNRFICLRMLDFFSKGANIQPCYSHWF